MKSYLPVELHRILFKLTNNGRIKIKRISVDHII